MLGQYNIEDDSIWQSYDGICPDCGEDMPVDTVEGQECANCGFTFKKDVE